MILTEAFGKIKIKKSSIKPTKCLLAAGNDIERREREKEEKKKKSNLKWRMATPNFQSCVNQFTIKLKTGCDCFG